MQPEEQKDIGELSQGQLMVRRFMRSKLSVFGGIVIILLYLMVIFAEFLAPYYYDDQFVDAVWAAADQAAHPGGQGWASMAMHVRCSTRRRSPTSSPRTRDIFYPIKLFVRSWPYKLLGLYPHEHPPLWRPG